MGLEDVVHGAVGGHRARRAVVAVERGDSIDEVAVGVEPDACFEVGSITKVMTATLVLQHVARGDLALDDPVVEHLPDLRLDPVQATPAVTVRHLLTHGSGIDCGDDFTDTGDGDDCVERYVAEAIDGSPFLHPPGERWSYSNGGFILLGRLVEVLDGRCWDDALLARVVEPLGLHTSTTARLTPSTRPVAGHRYDADQGVLVDEPGRMPRSAGPAGNVVASATALIELTRGLFDGAGRLLPVPLVEEMIRPQVAIRDGQQGLAWVSPVPGVVVHGGATRGSTAFLAAIPGVGALSVVADGPGAAGIALAVQDHLFGRRSSPPAVADDLAVDPSRFVGTFERRHVTQAIRWDGDHLVAEPTFHGAAGDLFPSEGPAVLTPAGVDTFTSRRPGEDLPTTWTFSDPDADGSPTFLLTNRLHRRVG